MKPFCINSLKRHGFLPLQWSRFISCEIYRPILHFFIVPYTDSHYTPTTMTDTHTLPTSLLLPSAFHWLLLSYKPPSSFFFLFRQPIKPLPSPLLLTETPFSWSTLFLLKIHLLLLSRLFCPKLLHFSMILTRLSFFFYLLITLFFSFCCHNSFMDYDMII